MKLHILFIPFLIVFFFTSCSQKYGEREQTIYNYKKHDFFRLTDSLVKPICNEIKPHKILYITDFVNESNLNNHSQLGFLLSNNLKVSVLKDNCTNHNVIKSFELAQNIKIGGDGSKVLSRKLQELATQNIDKSNQILVGSYIFTQKQVIFYLKLINLKSGNIIASNYIQTPLTLELETLEGIQPKAPIIHQPFHL
jgi:hypothetical protein